jgi:hypothetical protein
MISSFLIVLRRQSWIGNAGYLEQAAFTENPRGRAVTLQICT